MKKRVYVLSLNHQQYDSVTSGKTSKNEQMNYIQVERIYKWRSFEKTFTNPNPKAIISKKTETDSLEVKQLRKALKEKELELEILKKAVDIFSKSDGKSTNSL